MNFSRRTFIKRSLVAAAGATVHHVSYAAMKEGTATVPQQVSDHPFFAHTKKLEVIAHRGGNGQWPGETMLAMRNAVKIGVDILEMDIYRTRDVMKNGQPAAGELVLMHDILVNKTTNGTGFVYHYDVDEIQNLNAGYHWSPEGEKACRYFNKGNSCPYFNDQLTAETHNDLRVPKLREVFDEFPNMRMVVEMKPAPLKYSPAKQLCELIRKFEMCDKVLVASFYPPFMNEFRALCPEVATSASPWDLKEFLSPKDLKESQRGLQTLINERISTATKSSVPLALQLPYQLITPGIVERVKARNQKLHAWTVNDLVKMNKMKTLEVDGIITDYPGPLLSLLGR